MKYFGCYELTRGDKSLDGYRTEDFESANKSVLIKKLRGLAKFMQRRGFTFEWWVYKKDAQGSCKTLDYGKVRY